MLADGDGVGKEAILRELLFEGALRCCHNKLFKNGIFPLGLLSGWKPVSYTHLTLPTNREV